MTVSNKTKIKRHPERGVYDRDTINRILDEAFVCHVGFIYGNYPVVIPTIYGRSGDNIFIHGSSASRMMNSVGEGFPVCVEVSAKIRTAPPKDQEEDYMLKVWAGELPIKLISGELTPDPELAEETNPPGYLNNLFRKISI